MSKYQRLGDFLRTQNQERIPMSFADIERVTKAKLPPSAHKYRPWWSNNPTNSVLTRVWLDAGYESEQVDMAGQSLVFRRVTPPPAEPSVSTSPSGAIPIHPAYGALKGLVKVAPGVDLTAPADPDWADINEGRS
jgi:hypothetical protein